MHLVRFIGRTASSPRVSNQGNQGTSSAQADLRMPFRYTDVRNGVRDMLGSQDGG